LRLLAIDDKMKPGDLVTPTRSSRSISKSNLGKENIICLVLETYQNAVKVLHTDGRVKSGLSDQWEIISKCS